MVTDFPVSSQQQAPSSAGMTTLMLPASIGEEQDTHSCAKCKLVFTNLNEYIM